MDQRPTLACCQFADDETIEADPECFDCQTCQVADALDGLWPENYDAWELFHRLTTRFVVQAGLVSERWQALTADRDADARNDLFDRLTLIYDLLHPAKE